jgi:hypothetical protein
MKDADEMLKKILKEVDTNGDGKIQFEGTDPRSLLRYPSSAHSTRHPDDI